MHIKTMSTPTKVNNMNFRFIAFQFIIYRETQTPVLASCWLSFWGLKKKSLDFSFTLISPLLPCKQSIYKLTRFFPSCWSPKWGLFAFCSHRLLWVPRLPHFSPQPTVTPLVSCVLLLKTPFSTRGEEGSTKQTPVAAFKVYCLLSQII